MLAELLRPNLNQRVAVLELPEEPQSDLLPETDPALPTPQLYQDLLDRLPNQEPDLRSALGEELPSLSDQIAFRDQMANSGTNLGRLASKVTLTTTGCWTRRLYRNSEGYMQVINPENYGFIVRDDSWYKKAGITLHRLAFILCAIEHPSALPDTEDLDIEYVKANMALPPGTDVDHQCRNTACGNPTHTRAMGNRQNNELKRQAQGLESALFAGQMMIGPIGLDWLDERVAAAKSEDTGLLIATRQGPYRVFKADDQPTATYAKREPDPAFDALPQPAPDRRKFKSRAKKPAILPGQQGLIAA